MPNTQIISDNDIEKIYKITPIKRVDLLSVYDTDELQRTLINIDLIKKMGAYFSTFSYNSTNNNQLN